MWAEYGESSGGPPAQYECTDSEASTSVDAFVGIAGAYDALVGYQGLYGRDFLQEHERDLWEMLWGTVGLHPELRVRLIHGDSDSTIPFENSAAFEAVLADAGYDVELTEFTGGHSVPNELVLETVMELVSWPPRAASTACARAPTTRHNPLFMAAPAEVDGHPRENHPSGKR